MSSNKRQKKCPIPRFLPVECNVGGFWPSGRKVRSKLGLASIELQRTAISRLLSNVGDSGELKQDRPERAARSSLENPCQSQHKRATFFPPTGLSPGIHQK